MVYASGVELNGQKLYLPEIAAWKTLSAAPDTGPGRLMTAGSKGATVLGGLGSSIMHAAVRPGVGDISAMVFGERWSNSLS